MTGLMDNLFRRSLFAIVVLLILLPHGSVLYAQAMGTVTGTVTSAENGEPLPGVNVVIQGSSTGTTTDGDGQYELTVPSNNAVLIFSFVGFLRQEIPVNGREEIDVALEEDVAQLDELVVVGYGTQEKSQLTGAISSVSSAELEKVPAVSVDQALQGRMAGVDVISSSHSPGSDATIRIRGLNSINASNDPLFVMDGIPLSGGLSDINPDIIESIEVLKDASATAIYGARGSNGVVLITTKRGSSEGGTRVNFDSYFGVSRIQNKVDVLNAEQWIDYRKASRRTDDMEVLLDPIELENYRAGNEVDWLDLVLRDGLQQRHSVGVLGGSENTQFAINANFLEERGVILNSRYRRGSVQINLDHQFNDRFRVGTSTLLSTSRDSEVNTGKVLGQAMQISPLGDVYNEDGSYRLFPTNEALLGNPLTDLNNETNQFRKTRVFSSIYAEYEILDGLSYRLNVGPDLSFGNRGHFIGSHTNTLQGAPNRALNARYDVRAYTVDNTLTYSKSFQGIHNVDVTLLNSLQEQYTQSNRVEAEGLPSESMLWHKLSAGRIRSFDTDEENWSILSYMARINYALLDRYMVTLTARRDGSSRFGEGQKVGYFPSVALAWRISEEPFMQDVSVVSNLKIRSSYGVTGNTAIAPYESLGSLSNNSYIFGSDPALGFEPNTLANPDLRWESSQSANVGLDFGLFNNRLSGSVEFYRIDNDNLLLEQALPSSTGYESILSNIGSTRNTGFEFTLSSVNVASFKGFSWDTDLNVGWNRNEIVELYGGGEDDVGNEWFIGEPIDVHYGLVFDGIWQENEAEAAAVYDREPGHIKVKDLNNDDQITAEDRAILGSPFPDWSGGITNTFRYGGIDLSIFVHTRQNFMVNSSVHDLSSLSGRYNMPAFIDYYTPEDPSNTYPRPVVQGDRNINMQVLQYRDASFVRVRNITLGYTLPQSLISGMGVNSLRVYANAYNPFTFTDYEGWDPEAGSGLTSYPSSRKLLFGVNLSL